MNESSRKRLAPSRTRESAGPGPDVPPEPPPSARQRPGRAGPFGVLDVGTNKVCCLIGRTDADGQLRVLGFGWQKGRGVRKGSVVDLDEAERAVRAAVAAAEEMADHRLRSVVANLSCGQPEGRRVDLEWPVGGRQVTDADVRRVLAAGRSRAVVADGREVIHALPLGFTVDDATGVADPRRLHCDQLTARMHVVDAASAALRNLGATVAQCELDISELVATPLAAGMSTLVPDERELGAVVVDMGAGTTSMGVFAENQLVHMAQLPVGGTHVTNDIAQKLGTPIAHAERLKTLYGNAEPSPDDEREMLPVPLVGEEDHHVARMPRSMVVSVIRPRLEETFELVRDRLANAGLGHEGAGHVVLTGGASQLVGVRELASRVLNRQVRLGRPHALRGLPDLASGPAFATAAGLLAWASGENRAMADVDLSDGPPPGLLRRVWRGVMDRI